MSSTLQSKVKVPVLPVLDTRASETLDRLASQEAIFRALAKYPADDVLRGNIPGWVFFGKFDRQYHVGE